MNEREIERWVRGRVYKNHGGLYFEPEDEITILDMGDREVTSIGTGPNGNDYISLTDIARTRDAERTDYLIQNWLRNRNTIEFLGIWEQLNNPAFNPIEFDGIRREAGLNSFILTAKRWIDATGAIGITSKAGRYGGTYAHKDIAFEFATWISVEFKIYLIKEFQRLKTEEASRESREWSFQRTLAKVNYRLHADAIQEHLIPPTLTKAHIARVYASEADLLSMDFGITRSECRSPKRNSSRFGLKPRAGVAVPRRARFHPRRPKDARNEALAMKGPRNPC